MKIRKSMFNRVKKGNAMPLTFLETSQVPEEGGAVKGAEIRGGKFRRERNRERGPGEQASRLGQHFGSYHAFYRKGQEERFQREGKG